MLTAIRSEAFHFRMTNFPGLVRWSMSIAYF
jgi:hypothetical protein